ncbi:MAG: LON peptidase substrate-binding domain-containing protein [Alphaproteobacteria bacterium]
MTRRPFTPTFDELPEIIPIFPLSGVLLLPRGRLPLNIFEPRYLEMTADALAAERIIGMVQPFEPDAESRTEAPDVYPAGCAGRVTAFEETDDGRYEISLTGLARFEIVSEQPRSRRYRRAAVRWDRFAGDLVDDDGGPIARDSLAASLRAFLESRQLEADWDAIVDLPDKEFVTWLAMYCPFRPSEKQALLECRDLADRARHLAALMEMALHEGVHDDLPRQ